MGNEHSKTRGLSKKGAANGHVTIRVNGAGVTANGGTPASQNGKLSAVTSVEDSTLSGYVIVQEDSQQTEVVTDQTDGGPPTIEPESNIPTKTPNKESASPATSRAKAVSDPPAASKGMSIPPPPPPEPPKMEIKGESAAKQSPKLEAKAAAKGSVSAKAKPPKVSLGSFFGSKVAKELQTAEEQVAELQDTAIEKAQVTLPTIWCSGVTLNDMTLLGSNLRFFFSCCTRSESHTQAEMEVGGQKVSEGLNELQELVENKMEQEASQLVAEAEKKVDPSKTGTLEAAAKSEPPPPAQDEKQANMKFSFLDFFKFKPLGPIKMTSASSAAEPAPAAKAKEEPKVAVKSPEPPVEAKPAPAPPQAAEAAANSPKKLEKRNSIGLFFKNLSQKRNSTDAGIQTESAPVSGAPEKTK
ncbi:breast carcinoma-amplified sequence 1 isoform 2-T3 [Synchiropus picturatus]